MLHGVLRVHLSHFSVLCFLCCYLWRPSSSITKAHGANGVQDFRTGEFDLRGCWVVDNHCL